MKLKISITNGIIGGAIGGIISFVINYFLVPVPQNALQNGFGNLI